MLSDEDDDDDSQLVDWMMVTATGTVCIAATPCMSCVFDDFAKTASLRIPLFSDTASIPRNRQVVLLVGFGYG